MSQTITPLPMLAQAEDGKKEKNGAASELARRRAESLTPRERSEIARKAAKARWRKGKRKKH